MVDPFIDISIYAGWLRFENDENEEFRARNCGKKRVKIYKLFEGAFIFQGKYIFKGMFNPKNVYEAYMWEDTDENDEIT